MFCELLMLALDFLLEFGLFFLVLLIGSIDRIDFLLGLFLQLVPDLLAGLTERWWCIYIILET